MAKAIDQMVAKWGTGEFVRRAAAVGSVSWVEYIPQLDRITTSRLEIDDGYAVPPSQPGLGIEWDWGAIQSMQLCELVVN